MKSGFAICCVLSVALSAKYLGGAANGSDTNVPAQSSASAWNPGAAAKYLDGRAAWWESWSGSQRDHGTVCISCHTMLPYALARPKLRTSLNDESTPAPEREMLQYLRKRVSLWSEVQPYYQDASAGPGKSRESRSTESVLNALILSSYAAQSEHLDPLTQKAFDSAWALQLQSGDHAGAWDWQVFHLSPWEGEESQYQGATFMALATGWAPDGYRKNPAIQSNFRSLRAYLKREGPKQPLLNRVVVLWASSRMPGLLSKAEQRQVVDSVFERQHSDGGWSLSSLGTWARSDNTAQETESDGYATGLITLALESTSSRHQSDAMVAGRNWLLQHQKKEDGSWRAYSLNKKRDLSTDIGHFMTDAATGYAVMALAQ